MKRFKLWYGIFYFGVFALLLATVAAFTTACGGSPTSSVTATPTPSGFTLSGSVTFTSGSHNIYVITATGANVPSAISGPIAGGGTYSFSGLTGSTELDVVYDNAGTGLKLSGGNVVETNGSSISGSGDVTCVVGYTGSCPNTSSQNGTFYSSTSTINIVFGGTTNSYAASQSGTNCTQ